LLVQIANGQLAHPDWLAPGTVKVAIVGSTRTHFESYDKNDKVPPLWLPLHALETVQAIMKSSTETVSFDFLVCVMPSTALHSQVLPKFSQTIHLLLERRYSVHIEKLQLSDYGISVDKTFIVIVACPVCMGPHWDWFQPEIQKTFEDIIGDLAFQNPRVDKNGQQNYGLKCKKPSTINETIHNHITGHHPSAGSQPVNMNATALKPPFCGLPRFQHPVKSSFHSRHCIEANVVLHQARKDLLTVRKLARIYGFPDDFIFYDGASGSYHYFAHAVPPTIVRVVARGVREIVEQCRG
jgi:site-specific DNA-cytosine methylase